MTSADSIFTLAALVDRLGHQKCGDLEKVLTLVQSYSGNDWKGYVSHDDRLPYTRNLIYQNEAYTLMLLCWRPSAASPCHDHNGSECIMKLMQGKLTESRFKAGVLVTTHMTPGQVIHINDEKGVHSMANLSNTLAHSLHLYMPPYDTCRIVDRHNNQLSICKISFHNQGRVKSKL
jgi:cysteine dioxygenase